MKFTTLGYTTAKQGSDFFKILPGRVDFLSENFQVGSNADPSTFSSGQNFSSTRVGSEVGSGRRSGQFCSREVERGVGLSGFELKGKLARYEGGNGLEFKEEWAQH